MPSQRHKPITSLTGFIKKVSATAPAPGVRLLYRGHSDRDHYRLEPSLFRNANFLANEHVMYRELLISNPTDFDEDKSALDVLVRMQHYLLPTRLLDVTSNPLMALYFACDGAENRNITGEVIVLKVNDDIVKYFDSPTACAIANLAKLTGPLKDSIDLTMSVADFNLSAPIERLLDYIKEDKPHFLSIIDPKHLGSIVCVLSKMSNRRIMAQAGAFLLFGHKTTLPEAGTPNIGIARIAIKASEKAKILGELDRLNINESTVFPYIERSAHYITEKYKTP